eukprot:3761344-Rhodomonas_salina.3
MTPLQIDAPSTATLGTEGSHAIRPLATWELACGQHETLCLGYLSAYLPSAAAYSPRYPGYLGFGFGFRVSGFGFRVWGLGSRV